MRVRAEDLLYLPRVEAGRMKQISDVEVPTGVIIESGGACLKVR
jgi:hypothetical protein